MPSAVLYKKPRPKKMSVSYKESDLIPPNRNYVVLTYSKTDATYLSSSGKNSTVTFEQLDKDYFKVTEGDTMVRWNNQKKIKKYSMALWDEMYATYIRMGYKLYDTQKRKRINIKQEGSVLNGKTYEPIKDVEARTIVERLLNYASQMIAENYNKTIADVPDSAFNKARKILDYLTANYESLTNDEFNSFLDKLFAVLPRRIDVRAKYIAGKNATATDRGSIVETEIDRLNVLHSMLRGGNVSLVGKETILEAYGIELRPFTEDEKKEALKLLKGQANRFINGWRVINKQTETAFDQFCKEENLYVGNGIDYLFHGSKSENWWSILSNGLTISPTGVAITGKAYGHGTYFAPDAIKSLGYTSVIGAKYTNGGERTGLMGIYKVATGKRYDGSRGITGAHFGWNELQEVCPGAHCTWAEARYSGFMMDEVIVYQDCQSTVWALLELNMN